ncbi:MAG: rRNA maturation RNase YbeY [bacterium]|nr:rRNA maturation RNase YbeY [bacterium]
MRGVRRREINKAAKKVLHLLNLDGAELSILLVGDEEMRCINSEYRGKDRPTDVISFAMSDGEFPGLNKDILGDVVISLDTAKRQAVERGVTIMEEVNFLLIHGILHLSGYDHERSEPARLKMEKKERELIEELEQGLI